MIVLLLQLHCVAEKKFFVDVVTAVVIDVFGTGVVYTVVSFLLPLLLLLLLLLSSLPLPVVRNVLLV